MIDRAHAIASRPDVIFCSFGDMLRVPGSRGDLLQLKSQGSDVRIVYSPLDAVNLAAANPDRQVVFFAIGFETTAPPNAMAVWHGQAARADEFQRAGLARAGAAGDDRHPAGARQSRAGVPRSRPRLHRHGLHRIRAARRRYRVPIVITGFEPIDMLEGVLRTRAAARSGPGRGGEPVRPGRAARGQSARPGS